MPAGDNCQRKSLNLLLCNTDCCRNFFLSLVPSRTDVSGEFGGKAAVDLKSIPDRRSSPSRAAVTRAARSRSKEGGGLDLLPPWTWSGVWFIFTNRSSTVRADEDEAGGGFHPVRSGTSIHQYQGVFDSDTWTRIPSYCSSQEASLELVPLPASQHRDWLLSQTRVPGDGWSIGGSLRGTSCF